MATGKTIALTRWTFVSKVMSLLFNILSRFVIFFFLPRSRSLLILQLQLPSAVILEPRKIKSVIVSIVSSPICHEVMGPDTMILVFWMLRLSQLLHSPLSPCGSDSKASALNVGDRVRSLGWEDALEKEMTTHSSILAWRIPWAEEPGRLQFMGSQESDMT